MLSAKDVAMYFLSKDSKRKLFNKNVVVYNGRKSYEGNIRINKYLFLAQVVYLALCNKRLFKDDFKAYDNGPVIEDIVKSYGLMINQNSMVNINDSDKQFLDKIYISLENATFDELIEISKKERIEN